THSRAAVGPLVNALDDAHPAVRAAAAAALGVLGDKNAVPALRDHAAREESPSVRSQLKGAIDRMQGEPEQQVAQPGSAKLLLSLGQMRNLTGVRGAQLSDVLRGATRANAAMLPGVEVVADYEKGRHESRARKLPLLVIDGVVQRLAQGAAGSRLTVSAQV